MAHAVQAPANASVSFALTEEQKMIRDLARDFSRNEIAPVAEHYDKTHEFPHAGGQKSPRTWADSYGGS